MSIQVHWRWLSAVFWTLNILASMTVGFMRNGVAEPWTHLKQRSFAEILRSARGRDSFLLVASSCICIFTYTFAYIYIYIYIYIYVYPFFGVPISVPLACIGASVLLGSVEAATLRAGRLGDANYKAKARN